MPLNCARLSISFHPALAGGPTTGRRGSGKPCRSTYRAHRDTTGEQPFTAGHRALFQNTLHSYTENIDRIFVAFPPAQTESDRRGVPLEKGTALFRTVDSHLSNHPTHRASHTVTPTTHHSMKQSNENQETHYPNTSIPTQHRSSTPRLSFRLTASVPTGPTRHPSTTHNPEFRKLRFPMHHRYGQPSSRMSQVTKIRSSWVFPRIRQAPRMKHISRPPDSLLLSGR
ncbi:hypothetical protein SCOR_09040 [Sulfidibacter corallicola]